MEKPSSKNNFIQLIGIGMQMGIIIGLFAYLGKYLDGKYPFEKKWFTMICTITGVGCALYLVVKQLNRINNTDKTNNNKVDKD